MSAAWRDALVLLLILGQRSRGISADEQLLVETTETVDASVEVPETRWAPIPSTGPIFDELAFIDGVPRKEANVWVTAEDGTERAGVCASVAAGAAVISGKTNSVQSVRVHRGLYTTPGPETGIATDAGEYELVECTDPGEGFAKHHHRQNGRHRTSGHGPGVG